jgi:hypothetical protein
VPWLLALPVLLPLVPKPTGVCVESYTTHKRRAQPLGVTRSRIRIPKLRRLARPISEFIGGREIVPDVGDLLCDFNLEALDAAQMDDLGGATDKILAAQMNILAQNEVSDSG